MARGKKNIATIDHVLDTQDSRIGYLGFPPYEQDYLEAPYVVIIQMEDPKSVAAFVELLGDDYETLLDEGKRSAKSFWYPALERGARGGGGNKNIWIEDDGGDV